MQSITEEPRGRDIDVRTTMDQVGVLTMMSVGWQPKTTVRATDWFKVKVSRRYWLIIKLNAGDLYDVEVGRMVGTRWRVIEQEHDIFADMLAETVLKLGDRA